MSDGFGIGDGAVKLTLTEGHAEANVADAQRHTPNLVAEGRWPSLGTVIKVLAAAVVAIVLGGWLLTALNAGT